MSVSSGDTDVNDARSSTGPDLINEGQSLIPNTPDVVHSMLNGIKDDKDKLLLTSNVFCLLQHVKSQVYKNEACIKAVEAAMSEISRLENTQERDVLLPPQIPKDQAKKWVNLYYDSYQFEGFRIPLEKSFLLSVPDLLEIRHVHLDVTSRLIYYSVLLQGVLMDLDHTVQRGGIVKSLYRTSIELVPSWLDQVKDTPEDLFAAFLMISMALEGCNSELSWKIFCHACRIARALGYFSIDGNPKGPESHIRPAQESSEQKNEVEQNRMRFEFWHLLRTDCLFRLSFGKPAMLPEGSWAVNLPDPSITGVDDASTHFIQIHFLASMRLTLVVLKYLDFVNAESDQNAATYDSWMDDLIAEVEAILSNWNIEELMSTTKVLIDTWFCADILFTSYKTIIILCQAKKCNRDSAHLPRHTVDLARKSLKVFQSLMGSTVRSFWGISILLLHQFIFFFLLCLDMIDCQEPGNYEEGLALVRWVNEIAVQAAENRPELGPITLVTRSMTAACEQVRLGR
ncbi:hypothetical protein IFM46972_03488 [Aspergillus udagawae]|uniref:Xylanolytic transcriptional activator regulatory domain-containing protein n=1 Tax=Aspergillus udagawae TaxID=91492 RepID=A0A8E0QZ41_9EURO|nr:uncharacterized protein Aud_009591 [Aspergillus udagawae]GFF32259.1 hypothetical protein IFM46972_03488 [Aspergillus udagawae]GIC93110.1 hypothetical protein Aud_009591 [Aspergillus udagawae]